MSAGRMPGDQFISPSGARALVQRGLKEVEGGVQFAHDANLAGPSHTYVTEEAWLAVVEEVKCPVLFVRGTKGWPGSEAAEGRLKVRKGEVSTCRALFSFLFFSFLTLTLGAQGGHGVECDRC